MKPLLFILCALVAASCAPKAPLTPPLPTAPPKAILVAPLASKVRESIATADRTAAVIDAGAKEASKAATKARAEAERLKIQKTATEGELTKLWQSLQAVESRNLFLESQVTRLTTNLADARGAAATLQEHAAKKDQEAEAAQAQLADVKVTATYHAGQAKATWEESLKQRTRADKLAGEILLYRIALGICAALLVSWVAIRFFLPPRLL